jgi:predicted RNase H-like nuclease (RuvC/YqgF family)
MNSRVRTRTFGADDEQLVVPDEQEQRAAQATLDEQRGRLQATRQELNELRRTIEVNERDINMLEANAQAAQLQVQVCHIFT